MPTPALIPEHGTRHRYQTYGCRCLRCRVANAAYEAARRHRVTPGGSMTAARFFYHHAVDGRAVLLRHRGRQVDELGCREPRVWLCRVGGALVACDSTGPAEGGRDEGFLVSVADGTSVDAIRECWRRHRERICASHHETRLKRRASLKRVEPHAQEVAATVESAHDDRVSAPSVPKVRQPWLVAEDGGSV
jgi:hypothetical protein